MHKSLMQHQANQCSSSTKHHTVIKSSQLQGLSIRLPSRLGRPGQPIPATCQAAKQISGIQQLKRSATHDSNGRVVCSASSSSAMSTDTINQPEPGGIGKLVENFSGFITSLFPLWIIGAALTGYYKPEVFNWFTTDYTTWGLMFVMTGMGLTLTFQQIGAVFTRQPALLALGMVLQYTVLPSIGYAISRYWGLEPGLAVGVALVSCMPGGTASNIVAYIARGDMPLSVMMTSASTLLAVFMTPILSEYLVGQLVPIDSMSMFKSVLQLVLGPVMIGCTLNSIAPAMVSLVRPIMPLAATAVVVLIVGSMIACNVGIVGSYAGMVIPAVFVLHASGFCLGYWLSKLMGQSDKIARTNSIEVGMQSSALAAVLAKIHFPDQPMAAAACILSACTHALLGSVLAGFWNMFVQNPDA